MRLKCLPVSESAEQLDVSLTPLCSPEPCEDIHRWWVLLQLGFAPTTCSLR